MTVAVVIPSAGRASLRALVDGLLAGGADRVIVVDDRHDDSGGPIVETSAPAVEVVRGDTRGPAAARNSGWRAAPRDVEWIAFLDDDVAPPAGWFAALRTDLEALAGDVAASQGTIRVPLAAGRAATDWERNVAGLEDARWATADMAYRRAVLEAVGGFDERFPRAYREDADLGLRVVESGWRIVRGDRWVEHPVREADFWVSVRLQRGNADDALMRALHGPRWCERAAAPRGRFALHALTAASGTVAASGMAAGSRQPARAGRWRLAAGRWQLAGAALVAWTGLTAHFAWKRIAPGPRTRHEVVRMLATSAAIPFAATYWRLRGELRAKRAAASPVPRPPSPVTPAAVLFDRDGTLIRDVPYNGDPARVEPMPGARAAVERLRAAGIRVGVVSNQSGVARGLITPEQVAEVNRRVDELVGPLDAWAVCHHGPNDGCDCRKPQPGLVLRAARALGVAPERCAVVGDIGADVEAARAAGARGVLVPTPITRREEVDAAPVVAPDIATAADLLLSGNGDGSGDGDGGAR